MTTTSTKYVPFDPLRICDICGDLQRKSSMRRLRGGMWACPNEPQWRDAVELSAANARQKPFRILPVKDAKPENWNSPDSYEGDDGEILNFIARAVGNGARYESVTNGDLAPLTGNLLQAYGWSAQYLYGMIAENKRPLRMINLAKSLLTQIANTLLARQVGTTLSGSTTAAFGAFLESGATVYVTQDAASCGLALLYAYNVFRTVSYLTAARLAASYLRNVQSIGKCASNFTSSDAAGTARLYTGGVCSEVSTTFGGDPAENFYSNHLFYPGDLLTLQFWKSLLNVDGDQTVGTSGVPDGFVTSPAQLLSTSISEMRDFWTNGVRDSAGETYTGLSTATPREFFNAYPAAKTGFSVVGTGRWEFEDGGASTGTNITAQNFAMALSALYAYEGASSQVTEINTWLRSFSSNPDFEIPANESPRDLARSVLGTFDATAAPATLLTVRDADASYAATKKNGSGLYDWGAFGLLAPLWGNRTLSLFMESRKLPLGRNQRFLDGQRSDGDHFDWITLRGLSGMSYQTAFKIDLNSPQGVIAYGSGSSSTPAPSMNGLVFWVTGSAGLESSGGLLTAWRDQGPLHQDLTTTDGNAPSVGLDTVNGIPAVSFPLGSNSKYIRSAVTMKDRNGAPFTAATERTVFALILPKVGNPGTVRTGGPVFEFRETPMFQCLFDLESTFHANGFYWFDNAWPFSGASLLGPDTTQATYASKNTLAMWSGAASAGATVNAAVNGTSVPLTPSTSTGLIGAPPPAGFVLGNADNNTGTIQTNFQGAIAVVLVYDWIVTGADLAQTLNYLSAAGGLGITNLAMVNDAVRAAQFGAAFRINPSDPMQV